MSKKVLLIAILMFSSPLAGCTDGAGPENVLGCTSPDAVNYDENATMDDSSCDFDSDGDGVLDHLEVDGCTDEAANNHEHGATENDDSCDYDLDDDGVTDADEIEGCTNSTANNFDGYATDEDGSCDYDLDDDGVLDADEVEGCTDEDAVNHDQLATEEDGSCYYGTPIQAVMDAFEEGEITYEDAFEALGDIKRCTESPYASNRPCDLVIARAGYPGEIDPADSYDTDKQEYIDNIFDTLFRYESDDQGGLALEPRLALDYSLSEDHLTYSFELRQGVFFSNGDPFTSEDVRFSWCRTIDYGSPDSAVSWILSQNFECDSIVVHNDTHLSVTIFQPYAGFPATLSYSVGAVINSELCSENKDSEGAEDWECHDWVANGPIGSGTGPFYLEEPFENDALDGGGGGVAHLLPNWLYWEESGFSFNQIEIVEEWEWEERDLLFSTNQVDLADLPIEFLDQYCLNISDPTSVESLPGYNCEYVETFVTSLVAMKVDRDDENGEYIENHDCDGDGADDCNVMSVPDVRVAIANSFDYEQHRDETYQGFLGAQFGPIPNGFPFDDTQYPVFSHNLTLAEETLEDAGFVRQYDCESLTESGTPTVVSEGDRDGDECRLPNVLRIMVNEGNSYREAMGAQLSEDLAGIGVMANGTPAGWDEYVDMYYDATWDIRFSGWSPDYLDPDNYWHPFAGSVDINGDAYGTGFQNAELDDKILEARTESDSSLRWQLYSDAFEIWAEDPNMFIIGQRNQIRLTHDYVDLHPYVAVGTEDRWFDISKAELIEIALMHDQSGPISQFAPGFSSASWIAVDHVNSLQDDYRFVIVEYDTGCAGPIGAEAAQQIIDDGIGLVVGPMCSGASMEANSVLSAAGIPHISPASTAPALADEGAYPGFFRVLPYDGYEVLAVIVALIDAGGSNPLLVYSTNWVDENHRANFFMDAWEGQGNEEICGEMSYDEESQTPAQIAQDAIDEGCDEVVFLDYNWVEQGSTFNSAIVEEMIELGFSGTIVGDQQFGAQEWLDSFEDQSNADGVIGLDWTYWDTAHDWNQSQSQRGLAFSDSCEEDDVCLYESVFTSQAFDAVVIIAEASMLHHLLEQGEGGHTLGDAIRFIGHNWEGASGNITFDSDGEVNPGIAICSIIHNSSSGVTSLDCSEEWVPSSFENLPTGGYYGFDVYSGQASTED